MNFAWVPYQFPPMFSKLYHHLEEIKANTGRQQVNSENAEAWAGKISQQLEALNASLSTLNATLLYKEQEPPRRTGSVAALVVACLCFILLAGMLAIYANRFSAATDAARDRSTAVLHAYGDVNTRYHAVSMHALTLETHTARLDSLVRQQAQTIVELKRLNVAAFRTMYYLERDLTQYHQQQREQAVQQTTLAH
jgi:hypothetical protein